MSFILLKYDMTLQETHSNRRNRATCVEVQNQMVTKHRAIHYAEGQYKPRMGVPGRIQLSGESTDFKSDKIPIAVTWKN